MTPPAAAVPNGRVTGPAVHLRRPGPAAGSTRPQWSRAAIAARPAGQGSGAPAWRPKAQHGWCDHPAFQDRNVTLTLFVPEPLWAVPAPLQLGQLSAPSPERCSFCAGSQQHIEDAAFANRVGNQRIQNIIPSTQGSRLSLTALEGLIRPDSGSKPSDRANYGAPNPDQG